MYKIQISSTSIIITAPIEYCMELIGIKSSLDPLQLRNKIFPELRLLELHLYEDEVADVVHCKERIRHLLQQYPQLQLMLHCPVIKEKDAMLAISDKKHLDLLEKLYDLCTVKGVLGAVVHCEYHEPTDMRVVAENLAHLRAKYPIDSVFYFENICGPATWHGDGFIRFIEEFNMKKVTVDFTHFLSHHDENELIELIEYLEDTGREIYYHISDNIELSGNGKPLHIGAGTLDFERLIAHVHFGVIETYSSDEQQGVEMKEDYKKFMRMKLVSARR
jgi:hypothetical protein